MRITVRDKWLTVARMQLRLLPAWALTIDKCQGQNIPKSLPSLVPPGAGNRLTASHIYVALSCSKGRDHLMLMWPLTDAVKKILSNHISEADDRRLTAQATDTQRLFERKELFLTLCGMAPNMIRLAQQIQHEIRMSRGDVLRCNEEQHLALPFHTERRVFIEAGVYTERGVEGYMYPENKVTGNKKIGADNGREMPFRRLAHD